MSVEDIIGRLSTAYNKVKTSNNYKLLKIFADELDELRAVIAGDGIDTDETVYDLSGNSNHGTIHGAQWVWTDRGWALSFDGTDQYINVPASNSLAINGSISVFARVKIENTGDRQDIVEKYTGATVSGYMLQVSATGLARAQIGDGSTSISASGSTVLWDERHFIGFTYDDTMNVLKIWVDGMLENERTGVHLVDNGASLRIGGHRFAKYIKGTVDEIIIYNRCLSETEIGSILNGEQVSEGCVLYFPLNKISIKNSHFVETATGINLDRIGSIVNEMRGGDDDEAYRARIKTKYSQMIADGTKAAIKFALSETLGLDPSKIEFIEEFPANPAHFKLQLPPDYADQETLIVEIVDRTKGAGISWQIWWIGSKWDQANWDEGTWGS